MKSYLASASLLCLVATTPVCAQSSDATGVGVGIANSSSRSGAVAISGQGGQGGNSSLVVNNPANTTSTVNQNLSGTTTSNVNSKISGETTSNVNQNVSGATTSRIVSSGTTTVRTAPSMVAPGLAAAGLETCLGSASGTVSAIGFGLGGGSTYPDEGCQARLDSRTLFAYGLKSAAVARLCQRPDIWRSMPDVCTQYWPQGVPYPAGIAYAAPLVAPSGTYMSTGSIRVINGKTGLEGDCINYSASKQKCYQWAGEAPRRVRSAALTPAKTPVKQPPKKQPAAVEAIETAAPTPSNQ